MTDTMRRPEHQIRVVVADDDSFTTSIVGDGLRAQGFAVRTASNPDEAWTAVKDGDAHALVADLNFGDGQSGATLLHRVDVEFPWVGLVVLTSHTSPALAVSDSDLLPERVVYLVKSQVRNVKQLADAVRQSISGDRIAKSAAASPVPGSRAITAAQADVLRMLAAGDSTRLIAERRGTSIRAAETLIARVYAALGLEDDDRSNLRVAAVGLWRDGRITLR